MNRIELTPDQENATKGILSDIRRKGARPVLCGYAGTGKTVTTATLVARLSGLGKRVVVATPTHKARFQVERALHNAGVFSFQTSTVHRLLGLKMIRNFDTGGESFVPDANKGNKKGKEDLGSYDVVIVDETSMVNSQLYHMLVKEMGDKPVIFVGDDRQLLPVGEDSVCQAFTKATSTYRLSEVLRHDGAILNLATETRELGQGRAAFLSSEGGGSSVIAHRDFNKWSARMLDFMASEEAMKSPDYCRVLAWTNQAVNHMNGLIHKRRYGEGAPQYVPGMTCVTVDAVPHPGGKAPLLNSTVDVRVLSATFQEHRFPGDSLHDPLWDTWLLRVIPVGSDGEEVEVRVLDRGEEARWADKQKELAKDAKNTKAGRDRTEKWQLFYRRQDMVAKLEPASALTIHKSQGSTFQHVFLHRSIDRADPAEQNQLAYVGITRASQTLHVIED